MILLVIVAARHARRARRNVAPGARVLSSMIKQADIVKELDPEDSLRYLSILRNGLLMTGKRGKFPDADESERVIGFDACDAWLSCSTERELLRNNSAHNLGLMWDGRLTGLGGRYAPHRGMSGAFLFDGDPLTRRGQMRAAGCIERRPDFKKCEFDGRFSVVAYRGRFFVYARANLNPEGGGRFVQVTSTPLEALVCPRPKWAPFRLVSFAPGHVAGLPRRASNYSLETAQKYGNIYYMAVNKNPVGIGLLALFPIRVEDVPDETRIPPFKTRQKKVPNIIWSEAFHGPGGWVDFPPTPNSSAIALALTCDGYSFSTPLPLVRAVPASLGRTNDHPVDGFIVEHRRLYFYVHVGVRGTFGKRAPAFAMSADPAIHRYAISLRALKRYTMDAVAQLGQECSDTRVPGDDLDLCDAEENPLEHRHKIITLD